VGVDHVTLDMVVAVYTLGVVCVVFLKVAGLAKLKSHELAVGSVVLQLKPISPHWRGLACAHQLTFVANFEASTRWR
jgi:hypothetical protein